MTTTLTNGQVIESMDALKDLARRDLPVKAGYAISKNLLKLRQEFQAFEEVRVKLVEQHAARDDQGAIKSNNQGHAEVQDRAAFEADYRELMEQEVTLDAHVIPVDFFGDAPVPAAALMAIDWMLSEA